LSKVALRESLLREIPALAPLDAHNERLLGNAHPSGWVNPEPAGRYNLERHLMGGDCLNVGCVPSKALIRCAQAAAEVREASAYGVDVPEGVRTDFARVMERVRRLRAEISPNDSVRRFQEMGVDVFLGEGRSAATGSRFAAPPRSGKSGAPPEERRA